MLQTPKVAFRDTAIRQCAIEMDQFGQPKARSGNFATVYRAYRPDGSEFAVRVFNRRSDDRRRRYQESSQYLEGRNVPCLVGFQYDEKGIRSASDGQLYPLLTMDWVPGVTLFEWARDRSREGYQEALALGADAWLEVVRELAEANVVHGDLQHGNVLVSSEGYFKLVDYDCLCVPNLLNQPNLEVGLEPYQHPQRNAQTLMYPGLDNFSALVIYVALRALAAAPHLWISYVDNTGYDKLLFRREDFENPTHSPLYHELCNSPSQEVRDLSHYLFQLYRYDLHSIPPIDEVLLWCHSVEELLAAQDWDKAVQLVQRMSDDEPIGEHLKPQVEEAHRRVAARQALEEAYVRGDEAEVQRRYIPQLLDDYPQAADLVARAREAAEVREILETLKAQIRFGRWDLFRDTWREHQELLSCRPSAKELAREYKRMLAYDSLRRLLADKKTYDQGVIDAWNYLQTLGGHPLAESLRDDVAKRVARKRDTDRLRSLLEKAPETPTTQHDRKLAAAWRPDLLDDSPQFASLRQHYEAARHRIELLTRLSELTGQCTVESETAFEAAGHDLPLGYHPNLAKRVERAQRRLRVFRQLYDAVQNNVSDAAIVKAWRELGSLKGQGLVAEPMRERVAQAKRRCALVQRLRELPRDVARHERDQQLREAWDASLLADCNDARSWRDEWQSAEKRAEAIALLEAAMERADVDAVAKCLHNPILTEHSLPPRIDALVRDWNASQERSRLLNREALIGSLRSGNRSDFVLHLDADQLREIAAHAPHHQTLICQWIEEEVLPAGKSGLSLVEDGRFVAGPGEVACRWQWPDKRISMHCRLAVSREIPRRGLSLDDVEFIHAIDVAIVLVIVFFVTSSDSG
ncbi:MAG: hypothetical protein KDA42_11000, partial [Planctomycetales bacterium]|nr:hypothetical protein [Planctomycetales bacterium]